MMELMLSTWFDHDPCVSSWRAVHLVLGHLTELLGGLGVLLAGNQLRSGFAVSASM